MTGIKILELQEILYHKSRQLVEGLQQSCLIAYSAAEYQ